MRNKKIWGKVLALSLSMTLAFSTSVFAMDMNTNAGETAVQEADTATEEDVKPSAKDMVIEFAPDAVVEIPILSMGSGKYRADFIDFKVYDESGNQMEYRPFYNPAWNIPDEDEDGKFVLEAWSRDSLSDMQRGMYTLELIFASGNSYDSYETIQTQKFQMNVPETILHFQRGTEPVKYDGIKDIVVKFQNANGDLEYVDFTSIDFQLYTGGEESFRMVSNNKGKDFSVDFAKGEFTIKAEWLNRVINEAIQQGHDPKSALELYVDYIGVRKDGKEDGWYQPLVFLDLSEYHLADVPAAGGSETTGDSQKEPAAVITVDSQEKAVAAVKEASAKDKIVVNMNDATTVKKDLLEAAKGKNVTVELKMNGYSWLINGTDITAAQLKDINLEAKIVDQAIPSDDIERLVGKSPVKQLSLTHNGEFGFKATLRINVGKEYAHRYANLYYYNEDSKFEFMNVGTINEDGLTDLKFSHASDYAIEISEKPLSQNHVPADLQPNAGNHAGSAVAPKTGDNLFVLPGFVMLILALGMAAVYTAKLKKNR